MTAHLRTAQVAESAGLFADATTRVDLIEELPQAAADGRGMTRVAADAAARDDVRRSGRRRIGCGHVHDH